MVSILASISLIIMCLIILPFREVYLIVKYVFAKVKKQIIKARQSGVLKWLAIIAVVFQFACLVLMLMMNDEDEIKVWFGLAIFVLISMSYLIVVYDIYARYLAVRTVDSPIKEELEIDVNCVCEKLLENKEMCLSTLLAIRVDEYKELLESIRSYESRSQNVAVILGIVTAGLFSVFKDSVKANNINEIFAFMLIILSLVVSLLLIFRIQTKKIVLSRYLYLDDKGIEITSKSNEDGVALSVSLNQAQLAILADAINSVRNKLLEITSNYTKCQVLAFIILSSSLITIFGRL